MKKFYTFYLSRILAVSILALTFTSCSKDDDETLGGTYVFQSIHNIVFHHSSGDVTDMRKDGTLNEYISNDETAQELASLLSSISFRFQGSKVYLIEDGIEYPYPADYTISGGRMKIYEDGELVFTWGYKKDGGTYFIWDFQTFQALGMDIREFTQMGITDMEFWIGMRKK